MSFEPTNEPDKERTMPSAFVCRRCGLELTDFVAVCEGIPSHVASGESVLMRGSFHRLSQNLTYKDFMALSGSGYRGEDSEQIAFAAGDWLLHPEDVRYRIKPGASPGCCGWQPRGEFNALCDCGNELGTLHSDEC